MLEKYGISIDYIIIGLVGIIIVLLLLVIVLMVSVFSMKKKYNKFMSGSDGQSLDSKFLDKFKKIETIQEENKVIKVALQKISLTQKKCLRKTSIIHYDAFEETAGNLSFIIAMLNDENDGVILNSVYSTRSGCYVYAKEVINGQSYKVLTDEEKRALKEAINSDEIIKE